MNNIVVEVLDREHGAKVIKALQALGVNTRDHKGTITKRDGGYCRWYGVIDNQYSNFSNPSSNRGVSIVTLEHLIAMAQPNKTVNESQKENNMWVFIIILWFWLIYSDRN